MVLCLTLSYKQPYCNKLTCTINRPLGMTMTILLNFNWKFYFRCSNYIILHKYTLLQYIPQILTITQKSGKGSYPASIPKRSHFIGIQCDIQYTYPASTFWKHTQVCMSMYTYLTQTVTEPPLTRSCSTSLQTAMVSRHYFSRY